MSNNSNHHHHSGSNATNGYEKKLNVACKFYKSGKCVSGKSCKFLHEGATVFEETTNNHTNGNGAHSNAPVCKYYTNGYCKSGAKCQFQHIEQKNNKDNNNNNNNNSDTSKKSIEISSTPTTTSSSSTSTQNTPVKQNHLLETHQQTLNNIFEQHNNISSVARSPPAPTPTPIIPTLYPLPVSTIPINIHDPYSKSRLFIDDNQQQLLHNQPQTSSILGINGSNNGSGVRDSFIQFQFDTSPRDQHQTPKSPLMNQHSVTNIALSPQQRITNALSFFPNSPRTIISSSPQSPFSPQYGSHNATILSSSPSPFYPLGGFQDPSGVDDEDVSEDDDEDLIDFNDTGFNVIDDNYDDTVFDPFQYDLSKKFSNQLDISNINNVLNQQQTTTQFQNIQQSNINIFNNNNNNNHNHNNNNLLIINENVKDSNNENNINNSLLNENILVNTISSSTTTITSPTSSIPSSPEKDLSSFDNNTEEKKPLSYLDALKSNLQLPPDYYITYENQVKTESKTEALCHFYLVGSCRNGDNCKFIHGEKCQFCEKPMLVPNNLAQNKEHLTECMIAQERAKERAKIKNLECGICFDSIVEKGRRFGLLSHCNHVFCLDCIREWRGSTTTGQPVQQQHSNSTTSVRLCPMCRVNSYFIIPSDIYVSHEKKQEIIEIYRAKLGTIPCKYFNHGKGTCKFGTSCMYAHLNPDGSVHRPQVRKVQASYGDTTLHSNQLGMFIAPLLQQQQRQVQNRKGYNYDEEYEEEEYDDEEEYAEDENDD